MTLLIIKLKKSHWSYGVVVVRTIEVFFKIESFVMGYFDPINTFLITEINNFRGDLSGISAETATLLRTVRAESRVEAEEACPETHARGCA